MEEIEMKFDLGEYDGSTVAGFIQYNLQRSPITGDKISVENVTMTVTSIRNRRIKYVRITVESPEETDSEDNL